MSMKTLAAVAMLAPLANADTLTTNLDATTGGAETASGERFIAAKFASDATHDLTSITLLLEAGAGAEAVLRIYGDGGLEPGDLVATLASPASLPASAGQAPFTASGVTLEAGTMYWAVLEATSGEIDWHWSSQSTGSGEGFTSEWGVSDPDDTAFWWTQDGYPPQYSVTVDEETGCPADLAPPAGVLDLADIQAFVVGFLALDDAVDLAAPFGVFDLADIQAFVQAFSAGCP